MEEAAAQQLGQLSISPAANPAPENLAESLRKLRWSRTLKNISWRIDVKTTSSSGEQGGATAYIEMIFVRPTEDGKEDTETVRFSADLPTLMGIMKSFDRIPAFLGTSVPTPTATETSE
ncbi:hypothetical protein PAPYR_5343 [Paratrimastix pyriformis]|uniref:COMM domain-containing protein n=1 Tax=Paratrimastix pyriformis TaxID=342808 RepID=A0ABQ8ULJ7_9EUKA|nr:hypothetical protein PAPYR_5343 [Paratrimastix pyriformis]